MIMKPFLGCAYYPEDWEESQIPFDIAKMKEAGEGLVLCEIGHEAATIRLQTAMTDILTGKEYEEGIMNVAPYGVHVLVQK